MEYEKIIKQGFRQARKKVTSPSYAQDLMTGIFDTDEVIKEIKFQVRKHLFATSLDILRRTAPICSFAGTPRYIHALVAALKEIGANEKMGIIPYSYLSRNTFLLDGQLLTIYDLSQNTIAVGLDDQMIIVKSDPKIVADLIDIWRKTKVPSSMMTDMLKESFALNKIEEILLPTVRVILDQTTEDSGIKADIIHVRRGRLKIRLSSKDEFHVISTFYTSVYKLKADVERKIRRHKKQKGIYEFFKDESRENRK